MSAYIKYGRKNNADEVKKLQIFLNSNLGLNLAVNGTFGLETYKAVHAFQVKYWDQVLKPWVPHGLKTEKTSTGYVYKTTKRMINILNCPELNLPIPQLP